MAKVGIVLSGGLAKGAYEIGALQAISEYFTDKEICALSASSIGVLNGYAYMTGKLPLAHELWSSTNIKGTVRSFKELARTSLMYDIADKVYSTEDELKGQLYGNSFNFTKTKLKYFYFNEIEQEKRSDHLKACICFPLFSSPYEIDGMKYVDGALVDDVPVMPLSKLDLDYIIVVYFDKKSYFFENEDLDKRIIKINFYDDSLVKNYLALDKDSIARMIETGYTKSKSILDRVFASGTEDVPKILEKIEELNAQNSDDPEKRITGDVVLRNINRVVKKLLPKLQ